MNGADQAQLATRSHSCSRALAEKIVVIGAAGAIGKQLIKALADRGDHVVCLLRQTPLPEHLATHPRIQSEFGIDVADRAQVQAALLKHAGQIACVWNLAAPLSVETAEDPSRAHAVTVGGMTNLLEAMKAAKASKICFTDSIGSFGADAPRRNATARWLTENPTQDPGSAYGLQKRGCRELLCGFSAHGGDTRWAVVPGVLHGEGQWGNGTTEYALEAILAAHKNIPYAAPLADDVTLPMIFSTDLIAGLLALQDTPKAKLTEPESGYALAGFSFMPSELYTELKARCPGFTTSTALDANVSKFAQLWPDALSPMEAERDLGFIAQVGLHQTVDLILKAHEAHD